MVVLGASSAVLSAEYHTDENWTSGSGGEVPNVMPPCLLAALRYTSFIQSVVSMLVFHKAPGLAAIGSNFDSPYFWHDRGVFHVWIFSSSK